VSVRERITAALSSDSVPIVLTGGGGWLGQATLDFLDEALGHAMLKRVFVYGSHTRMLPLRSGRSVECNALEALAGYAGPPPLVLHYACLTKDRVADHGAQAFLAANKQIRETVAAFIERRGAYGMFLPSSGAVYGPGRSLGPAPDENPYGAAKLLDEQRFAALALKNGAPLVIARIFNLAGPFINKPEAYAIADFLLALIEGRRIEIRARGSVYRSYLHVEDLLLMALGILLLAPDTHLVQFDTEGEVTIEVEDLARRAAMLLDRLEVPIHRAAPDGRPDDVYVGDGKAMRAIANGLDLPLRVLDRQILDTARYLKGE